MHIVLPSFSARRYLLPIALLLVFAVASNSAAGERPKVVFANPGGHGDAFFQLFTNFMQAAADDLGFDMAVYYGDRNHVLIDENVEAIFKRDPLPDYIIGMNARGSGKNLLKLAETHKVKTIFVNQSFLGEDRERMGVPGERFKMWMFEYLPDDVHAGYMLAKELIERATALKLANEDGKIGIIAISGHETSAASLLREQGLEKAVAEYPNVELLQTVHAGWKRDRARELSKGLLKWYPDTAVIWAASDKMAMGVCEGVRELGKKPGINVLTGGVDWAVLALNMVKNGDFAVSIGGHFMDGAWALVMLYDAIHGSTFPRPTKSRFSSITTENVDSYQKHFGSGNWRKIDFTRFSKYLNPEMQTYDFSLDAVLRQVEQ